MKRGWVRVSPRMKAKRQDEAMEAAGVTTVYRDSEDETVTDFVRSLRAGDEAVAYSMDRLARRRSELQEVIAGIHERGAVFVELSTGRRSDNRDDLANMIFDAANALSRDGTAQQVRTARRNGALGGRPKKEDRMPLDQARREWFDVRNATIWDAIAKMPGWSVRSAYREFKKRGFGKSGRRSK
jgi:DNA invertase Pin-like site-specific DNA recombinase